MIRSRVEALAVDHPLQQRPDLDPKLDLQLPWIGRTLEEAANALETGLDPFGNPISNTQITGGLRTLISMVTAPSYLMAMDLGHPGITPGLQRCMADLGAVIDTIEHSPTAVSTTGSAGVETLVELCTGMGILLPSRHIDTAVEQLTAEGPAGSIALAQLIKDLLFCRSAGILHALEAARRVAPVPQLTEALEAVTGASELTESPANPRFTPEIVGDGRCGWTSGTYEKVMAAARKAQRPPR
ncbi:MAG: hypothetical protein KJ698_09110 [Actinobacteria bacterium]|nr:hypothetical protein [Actinomycetota bacterium]MBU1494423.1 hypothetical protein [Actinomycetota bacterium]